MHTIEYLRADVVPLTGGKARGVVQSRNYHPDRCATAHCPLQKLSQSFLTVLLNLEPSLILEPFYLKPGFHNADSH